MAKQQFRVIDIFTSGSAEVLFTDDLKLLGFEAHNDGSPGYRIYCTVGEYTGWCHKVKLECYSVGATWDKDQMKVLGCFLTKQGESKVVVQHNPNPGTPIPPDPQEIVDKMEAWTIKAGNSPKDAEAVMFDMVKQYYFLDDPQKKQLMDLVTDKYFLQDVVTEDVDHQTLVKVFSAILFIISVGRLNENTRRLLREFAVKG